MRSTVNHFPMASAGLVLTACLLCLTACGGSDEPAADSAEQAGIEEAPGSASDLLEEAGIDPEKVVAKVNGREIRAGKVYEVAAINMAEMLNSGVALDAADEDAVRRIVLRLIIDDELLTGEAEATGVELDPEMVDEEFQRIQDQYGTASAFDDWLAERGIDRGAFRAELERRLLKQTYVASLAEGVTVTDEEARMFYDAQPALFLEGGQAQVQQILIRSSPNDPPERREDAERRISEALGRARAGEDFGDLAREYSQAPNAAAGGVVSYFPRGVMVPKFEEVAFNLPIGAISDVFETPYGFNIVKVLDRKEPTPIPFAEAKPDLKLKLLKFKESQIVQAKIVELRAAAEIEILDPDFAPPEEGEDEEPSDS